MSESLDEIERFFLALSDKTRIKLVGLIGGGEVSVNYLCEALEVSQPKVSRHLAYLRSMGMVDTRRDGKWIFYSLIEPKSQQGSRFLRDTLNWIDSTSESGINPTPFNSEPQQANRKNLEQDIPIDTYDYPHMREREEQLEIYLL